MNWEARVTYEIVPKIYWIEPPATSEERIGRTHAEVAIMQRAFEIKSTELGTAILESLIASVRKERNEI